jgi:hypothetical protein
MIMMMITAYAKMLARDARLLMDFNVGRPRTVASPSRTTIRTSGSPMPGTAHLPFLRADRTAHDQANRCFLSFGAVE